MSTSQIGAVNLSLSVTATKAGRTTTGYIKTDRQLANGTAADQADKTFYNTQTIAYPSTPDSLNFSDGSLIDLNGDGLELVDVTTLAINNKSATATLTVGNGTNPFDFGCGSTGTKTIKPGERVVLIDLGSDPGYAVSSGSADTLKVAIDAGTNVDYEIIVIGRSA
jgi:hypothetical protein